MRRRAYAQRAHGQRPYGGRTGRFGERIDDQSLPLAPGAGVPDMIDRGVADCGVSRSSCRTRPVLDSIPGAGRRLNRIPALCYKSGAPLDDDDLEPRRVGGLMALRRAFLCAPIQVASA